MKQSNNIASYSATW